MEELIIIFAIGIVVLQVILIIKFFELCSDTKALKEHFCKSTVDFKTPVDCDHDAPIGIGDIVLRLSDGAEMLVDRMDSDNFACVNPVDRSWMGVYARKSITPKI